MSQEITNTAPIGVFDSGVGGLTVAREIMRQLPNENIVYFGDTARVPYVGGACPASASTDSTASVIRSGASRRASFTSNTAS